MTAAFWPGLLIAALLIGFWLDTYGIEKWRSLCAREEARRQGRCVDCGDPLERCTCIVFTPDDWDDE